MSLYMPEPQVLVATVPGARDHWVLLRRLQDAVWLALGSALEVEVLDLKEHRVIVLGWGHGFPLDGNDTVRTFVEEPTDLELREAHARAARKASLLGLLTGTAAGIPGGFAPRRAETRRVCDYGSELFGDEIPDDVVSSLTTSVDSGSMRRALIAGFWRPGERMREDEVDTWLASCRGVPR